MTKNARKGKSARGVAGLTQLDTIKIMFNIQIKIISDNNNISPLTTHHDDRTDQVERFPCRTQPVLSSLVRVQVIVIKCQRYFEKKKNN